MKYMFGGKSLIYFYCKYAILLIFLLLASLSTQVLAAEGPELQAEDCVKCHRFQVRMVAEGGGNHASEVGCLECHPQHPPKVNDTKVACVHCHEGEPHFEIGDCLHCHVNPHRPLESLRDPLKPVRKECLSCHSDVGQEMTVAPSRHSELFCNRCHNSHKKIPGCLDCHGPHLGEQSARDCLRCHSAHQPLQVIAAGYVPATFCKVCHAKQASNLADTNTNHGGINCTYCHEGVHPSTPACQECHGLPHPQAIHSKHTNCLECHGDAHRLISHR